MVPRVLYTFPGHYSSSGIIHPESDTIHSWKLFIPSRTLFILGYYSFRVEYCSFPETIHPESDTIYSRKLFIQNTVHPESDTIHSRVHAIILPECM